MKVQKGQIWSCKPCFMYGLAGLAAKAIDEDGAGCIGACARQPDASAADKGVTAPLENSGRI